MRRSCKSSYKSCSSTLTVPIIDSSWRLVLLRDLIQKRILISFLSNQRRGRIPSHDTWGYLKHHFASHLYCCPESERQKVLDDFHRFHDEFKFSTKVDTLNDSHLVFESLHALMTALVNVGRPFIAFNNWNIVLNMVIEIDRIIRCRPRNGLLSIRCPVRRALSLLNRCFHRPPWFPSRYTRSLWKIFKTS
jgi:hypothetical protein